MSIVRASGQGIVILSRIVVKGDVNIEVNDGTGWKDYSTLPHTDIDISLGGMFISCDHSPEPGSKVRITWTDPPFARKTFRATATFVETSGGIHLKFDQLSPVDQRSLYNWIAQLEARLGRTRGDIDPAVQTSMWYTAATAVSAGGLFLGGLAVLFQLLVGDRLEPLPVILLAMMVITILLFTVFRILGGIWERKAIKQTSEAHS